MSVVAERLNTALEGRYRIERKLGEGGMATVYLADDLRHERKVALKVLKPELAAVVGAERFLAEIKTTANLQHPHILPLFDSGEAVGFLFYVMPYIDGESLREKLERERQLPVDEAVQIATSVAEALEYAHRRGVIHRDIKPANILIHDGQAVVSDFGIALAHGVAEDGRLTRSGTGVGTPSYASPEQADGGGEVDARADIYSLACVLHEMLAGEPVFTGRSSRAVVAKHLAAQPAPIRALRSTVPEGVERAILKGLQKSPVDRFASMSGFATALREGAAVGRQGRPLADALREHPMLVTALAVVIVGGAALVTRQRNPGPAWVDRPPSLVVLPFSDATSTPEEVALSVELSEVAAREINRWDPVNAVPPVDLAGPRMDMGLGTASLERIDDGITLAREVRAEALLALTVTIEGDSASVEAQLYEARTARRVDSPFFSSGAVGSSTRILAPILAKVLGFGDAAEPTRAFRAGTRDPEAAAEYLAGVEDLYRNQLEAAETRFRRAIERDPTFATALTSLGQTLFWRWVESGEASAELGPEIALRSTAAMDHLAGLSDLNRLRVRGFYAFQLGDYEQARSLYRSVRESDPNDLLALMMIGEIEISDPWMASVEGKPPRPRSDLGLALESLLETVTLVPTFELGYGRMLTLQASVEAALGGTCGVFDEIREPLVPPWSHFTPSESAVLFCPAVQDSFTWMSMSEYAAADASALRQGADRLLERFASAFERWASFSPQQPRALERLSEVRLIQRRRARPAAPERLRRLGEEALDYLSQSLALRADTTAEQLVRLANLYLAAGQRARGIEVAREVSDRYATSDPAGLRAAPSTLDNPLVVGGQTSFALAVASGVQAQRFVRSPSTPTVISYAGAEPIFERIRVLGSMGIGGPLLRAELEQLGSTWSIVGYSASDQELLRNTVTPSLAPALLTDSVALRSWAPTVAMDGLLWQALTALYDEPGLARELYARAVADESDGLRSATQTFVLGGIAGALGLHSEAIGHYSLLDSIPHGVDYFDPGWGLQVLSHGLRAEHYEQLGQLDEAREQLLAFIDARTGSDSLALPGLQAARRDLARIQGALRGLR